jgi:hypothetical protein
MTVARTENVTPRFEALHLKNRVIDLYEAMAPYQEATSSIRLVYLFPDFRQWSHQEMTPRHFELTQRNEGLVVMLGSFRDHGVGQIQVCAVDVVTGQPVGWMRWLDFAGGAQSEARELKFDPKEANWTREDGKAVTGGLFLVRNSDSAFGEERAIVRHAERVYFVPISKDHRHAEIKGQVYSFNTRVRVVDPVKRLQFGKKAK